MASKIIKFGDKEVKIGYKDNKLVKVTGDKTLADIVANSFLDLIERNFGFDEDDIDYSVSEILKPGDDNYIKSVLYNRIQNEYGMKLTEPLNVNENDL